MKRAFQLFLFVGLTLVVSAPVQAQMPAWEDRGFLNVNFGFQNKTATELAVERSFTLYDEAAKITASQTIETSGGIPDFMAGARLFGNFGLGLGYNRISTETISPISASIPHPVFYDQPRTAAATEDRLKHVENALHVMGIFVVPVGPKFDIMLSAGPTFFSVEQGTPNLGAIQVGPDVAPYSTVTLTSVGQVTTKKTQVGYNVGADITLRVAQRFGIGGFVRYTGANVEVTPTGLAEAITIEVGGIQFGGGIRIRF
jgi:hypothetical protein